MFGAYSGMLWYLTLGINLMMRLVLKTEWLEDRQWILHFLTWPIAAAFCIAAYSVKGIAYLSLGNCYLSDQWADPIFFYPFTVITILAVISFLISSGYIAFCMFTSNIGNTGDSQSNLNDNTSTQSKLRQRVKDANTKAMKFWKLQWVNKMKKSNSLFLLFLMLYIYIENYLLYGYQFILLFRIDDHLLCRIEECE